MLASDIVNGALLLINAIAVGESPSTAEAADGLALLQDLLASWSSDELLIFATSTAVVNLVNGTQSYVLGARPQKILSADTVVGTLQFAVEVVGPDGWAGAEDRNSSSGRIRRVYCDYAFPTATAYVSPIPNTGATMNLYVTVDLATLAASGSTFSMPQPYARALKANLAVELAPQYGRTVSSELAAIAGSSKAALQKLIASNRAGKSALELPPAAGADQ